MPVSYIVPSSGPASSEEWNLYAISNGAGANTCTFTIFGSNGERFTLTGTY
jgi:hypothetical protein